MELAELSRLILGRSQSHILFTGWSAKCSSLKSSSNLNLLTADYKGDFAVDEIIHVDVTLEGGEEAALAFGATASLPCLVRYQASDTLGHSPVTIWVLESVESEAQVLEFVHATNINAVPSSTLILPPPASSNDKDAEPNPMPIAAAEPPAAAVPGPVLSQQHATIRSIADSGGCVRIFVAGAVRLILLGCLRTFMFLWSKSNSSLNLTNAGAFLQVTRRTVERRPLHWGFSERCFGPAFLHLNWRTLNQQLRL